MKNHLILYYSKTGNNRYLANRLAKELNGDIEELRPLVKAHLLLMMNLGFGIKKLKHNVEDYERVILCGPIWVGRLIFPFKRFIKKHSNKINQLAFITCCGSSYEMKEEKFGHELVFQSLKSLVPNKSTVCKALPILLVVPEDKKEDSKAIMAARLNDQLFNGEILDNFNDFVELMKQKEII